MTLTCFISYLGFLHGLPGRSGESRDQEDYCDCSFDSPLELQFESKLNLARRIASRHLRELAETFGA